MQTRKNPPKLWWRILWMPYPYRHELRIIARLAGDYWSRRVCRACAYLVCILCRIKKHHASRRYIWIRTTEAIDVSGALVRIPPGKPYRRAYLRIYGAIRERVSKSKECLGCKSFVGTRLQGLDICMARRIDILLDGLISHTTIF